MASKRDTDLFQALRAAGLRKKVAHAVTDTARKTRAGKQSKLLVKTIENLNTAAAEIERRTDSNKRTDAAKQATQTRKRKAAARSTVADTAAKTRTDTEA
jgi:hypothetical protein